VSVLQFDGIGVKVSSEEKVLFPDDGITKGELIAYYRRIAEWMIPHVRERPLSMLRYPEGIGHDGFYQQEAPDYFPEWVDRIELDKKDGRIVHAVCNHAATLVYLANQNTITPHVWLSRVDRLYEPDQIIFDLDLPGDDFEAVRLAARAVRDILEEQGLTAFVMTTGSNGMHVRAPIQRRHKFDEVRAYARDLAEELALRHPDRLTTEQRKVKREGRIYLDVLRIAYGQTAVPPYAVRARPGAPVATPLDWSEIGRTGPRTYTIRNIFRRLGQKADPWADMFEHAADIRLNRRARSSESAA